MLLVLLLAAAAPAPPAPLRVLILDLRSDGAPDATARMVRDEIAVSLGHDERLDVLSSEDLRRVVSVQADKDAAGCTDESCLAEMGTALGARYIVHGSIGLLGGSTIVHLNLFDTKSSKAVARETAEARSNDELLGSVRNALDRIRARIGVGPRAAGDDRPLSSLTWGGGIATGVGAVGLVAGFIGIGYALPIVEDKTASGDDRASAQGMGAAFTVITVASGVVVAGGAGALAYGLMQ